MIQQITQLSLPFVMTMILAWTASAAEPTVKRHLDHARTAILKRDMKTAGRELRAASENLFQAAKNSPGAAKEGLEASGRELTTLAEDVEKGSVIETRRLDEAAGRAFHALAHERFVTASEAWAKKDARTTGRALREAADYLEDGASAVDRDTKSVTKDVVRSSRDIAGKLVRGAGWTSEEVGKGMDSFGKELSEFGKRAGSKK